MCSRPALHNASLFFLERKMFMYEGKTRTLFKKYAIAQMIGLLFNSIYLIVDGVFIGIRLGRDSMAAAAVSVPFIEILLSIAMAVASGAGIMISNHLGKKEKDEANKVFNISVIVLIVISAIVIIFGNIFINQLANLLGSTKEIHDESIKYLWYIVTFSPFLLFSFLLGGIVRNDGRPKLAMFALVFGSLSNILLDYVFMYPLNMGISGAALATALGPIFSVLILLPHFLRKRGNLYFSIKPANLKIVKKIFSLGFPSFIMEFTIGIITFIYNYAIIKNGYGEIGLAAYLVIGYLMLIILTIFLGMAEGLQPVFSYFNSVGETKKNKDLLKFSVKVFLSVGVISYVLIFFFSGSFYKIFTPDDLELVRFAKDKSYLYFSGFFLAGFNILMISYWQSTQLTKESRNISLLRSILVPPLLIILLPLIFSRESIWLAHSLGEAITTVFAIYMLLALRRGKAKELNVDKSI